MAIIEGTAYWASLTRPNEKFEPMWRIDLAVAPLVCPFVNQNDWAIVYQCIALQTQCQTTLDGPKYYVRQT